MSANNFNETEYLGCRSAFVAAGKSVFVVSDTDAFCTSTSSYIVKPDIHLYNCKSPNFSSIALIGGNGIRPYRNSVQLKNLLVAFRNENKVIAAICLAPLVLAYSGAFRGTKMTAHAEAVEELKSRGVQFIDTNTICDENVITASGPDLTGSWAKMILQKIEM